MKRLAAATAVLALALSACGGGGGRPSVGEIEDALQSEDNPVGEMLPAETSDELFSCMAEALESSDLSDEALQALVDGDEDVEAEDGDEEAMGEVTADITDCATESVG